MKYRKKPVVIEAFLVDGVGGDFKDADGTPGNDRPQWWRDALRSGAAIPRSCDGQYAIKTAEGEMRANVGDWIIQGIAGELYPCKPDIFAATYEEVSP